MDVDVTITQFRRDLFALVEAARKGDHVSFVHKGVEFKVVPSIKPNRLDRITPMQVTNASVSEQEAQEKIENEMARAWEEDWSDL